MSDHERDKQARFIHAFSSPLTAMRSAIGGTTALLDVWPGAAVHRARRTSRRVVTTWGRTLQAITADAAKTKPASSVLPSFDLQTALAAIPTHPLNVAA